MTPSVRNNKGKLEMTFSTVHYVLQFALNCLVTLGIFLSASGCSQKQANSEATVSKTAATQQISNEEPVTTKSDTAKHAKQQNHNNKSKTANGSKKTGNQGEQKNVVTKLTEDQAREKLKLALDSWTFGDSREKFGKAHPDVDFIHFYYDLALNNYSITRSRAIENGYQFVVTHSFKKTNGISYDATGDYKISLNEKGVYVIVGLPQ